MNSVITQFIEFGLLFKTPHHPRTLGPTQLKRTITPLFLLLPVKSPALVGPSPSSSGTDRICSVLRPLPAKTRRDSILPAPLFLPCHFYLMLWPRISVVFERYGRRVFFLSTLSRVLYSTLLEWFIPPFPGTLSHPSWVIYPTLPGYFSNRSFSFLFLIISFFLFYRLFPFFHF